VTCVLDVAPAVPSNLSQCSPKTGNGRWYTRRLARRKCVRSGDENRKMERCLLYRQMFLYINLFIDTNGMNDTPDEAAAVMWILIFIFMFFLLPPTKRLLKTIVCLSIKTFQSP